VVTAERGSNYTSSLIKIDRPLLRIPTLAIHRKPLVVFVVYFTERAIPVDRSSANDFKFNTETEFTPILGLLASNLNAPTDKPRSSGKNEQTASSIQDNHHPALLSILAGELGVKPEDIHDFEL
jgi:aspartyl aminopeptidase